MWPALLTTLSTRREEALAASPDGPVEGPSDAVLVVACRQGQGQALGTLVERYQHDVFGTVLRLCHQREVALELTNAIFFKAYQHLDSYDESRPLRPWLLRIASNETLNWLRSQRREREHVLDGEANEQALEQMPGNVEPEEVALGAEQRETVLAALAQLPEHYRLVLTLRFFDDLSYAEIAAQTGQEANAVGVQLLRARRALKAILTSQVTAAAGTPPVATPGAAR